MKTYKHLEIAMKNILFLANRVWNVTFDHITVTIIPQGSFLLCHLKPTPTPASSESNEDTDSVTWVNFHSDRTLSHAFCLWRWGLKSSQSLGQAIVSCICVCGINNSPHKLLTSNSSSQRPPWTPQPGLMESWKSNQTKERKKWNWVDPGLCHLSYCSTKPPPHPLSRGKPHSCFRSHFLHDKPISHLNSL